LFDRIRSVASRTIPEREPIVRIGRSDAMLLFSKWLSDKSLLACEGSFSNFVFSLRACMLSVNDEELRMLSDDTHSELVLRFTPEMEFGFGDSRNAPESEKKYESCVIVFFGTVSHEGTQDSIAIAVVEQ
jgi:hypothetical protein